VDKSEAVERIVSAEHTLLNVFVTELDVGDRELRPVGAHE
jgi:hypothetical protein